jgi:S1-C subfamily serine protease
MTELGAVHLTFTAGSRNGRGFDLPPGRFLVGRSTECQLILHDAGVSGRHAELTVAADRQVTITDLGSANGTWVDGERIAGTWAIGDGTQVSFGPIGAVLAVPHTARSAFPSKHSAVPAGRAAAAIVALAVVLGGGYALAQALDDNRLDSAGSTPKAPSTPKSATTPRPKPPTRAEILARAREATVRVSVPDSWGSGFVVGFDRGRPLIVTNAHVVGDVSAVEINSDRQDRHPATVLGVSQCDDLAVVRGDEAMKLPKLTVSKPPEVGDDLWIVGFPGTAVDQESFLQVHAGRVASVGATYVNHDRALTATYRNLVQVDGTINKGNSGGPLVEEHDGRVVGVAAFGSPQQPENYGIASDRLAEVLPYLRTGTSVPGMALGFNGDDPEPRILEVSSDNLKHDGVEPNGGQRIVAVDGKRFDAGAFPHGLASLCDALPELGDGIGTTVKYTIRKPDGQLFFPKIDY